MTGDSPKNAPDPVSPETDPNIPEPTTDALSQTARAQTPRADGADEGPQAQERDVTETPRSALDETYTLSPDFVRAVVEALDATDHDAVRALVAPLHVADVADLLELIRPFERRALIKALGDALDPEVLSELDEDVRDDVLEAIEPAVLAEAITVLDNDDAVYLLEDLEEDRQKEILAQVPERERAAVELGLQFPEYSAGRLMQRDVIAVPETWTVGQVIDYAREDEDLPDEFFDLFIVDPAHKPVGSVPLGRLLRQKRDVALSVIAIDEPIRINASMEQEEAAYLFQQYHLVSAPVVDEAGRLLGMLTVDDMMEVMQDEAEEDVRALAGVGGDEGLSDPVLRIMRQRFSWLFVNLLTAVLASLVISMFDRSIQEVVALAVLMPIVASMGGNAGTQTLTVAVRALATRDLTPTNAMRIVLRESLVGTLNGIAFALIMGVVAIFWFQSVALGAVVALAMVVNLALAGLAGMLVPLSLQRAGADPALASTVFVTTVTDVAGFFVFLGLASVVLIG